MLTFILFRKLTPSKRDPFWRAALRFDTTAWFPAPIPLAMLIRCLSLLLCLSGSVAYIEHTVGDLQRLPLSLGLFRDSVTSSRESVLTSSPLGRVPLPRSSSIQSPLKGHLGSFQVGVIVKKASLCAHVQVLVRTYVFLAFGSIPTSGIAGSHGKLLETASSFPKWLYHFACPPGPAMYHHQHSVSSTILFPRSDGCGAVSHWG